VNNRNEIKDALRQMLAVMEQERQALADLDIDAITGCTTSKTALCDRLGQATNDNLDEECLSLIEATKRLNEVNRQIRNLIAANVSSRLDAMTGAPALYKLQDVRAGYAHHSAARGI
jgi:flagellar biosynthesis/type III secretory pathway chaperone